ncbi:MAG: glycoside hydrolase family 2 TIM barrel-domain containing protein, partial [Eubacteriales bacterium]
MQDKIYLNNHWFYAPQPNEEIIEVRIPHANIETPFHHFDDSIYQFVSCYSRNLYAEDQWEGKHVFITFEGVAHIAKVYVGDQLVGTHLGGYTAFTLDLAPYLRFGMDNTLMVEVDASESSNIPPFGNVIDYLTYGGIYRDVYLEIKENVYIADIFVKAQKNMVFDLAVVGDLEDVSISYAIRKVHDEEWTQLGEENLEKKSSVIINELADIDIEQWDIDHPVCYQLKVELKLQDQIIDEKKVVFGFKTQEFRKDGFYLNDKKIKIVGLNRHQSYPYVGYAMPKRPQQLDADILKYELGVNAVRTSHYPQSHYFLERCDEIGLLVFTELPGWQHIGDSNWKDVAVDMVEEMVRQYRNHPSIILWGARINESQDDERLYRRTNAKAHELDESRQTGGVRFIKKSNLLEDVYTYNDFSHTGKNPGLEPKTKVTSNVEAPYLVTEYNGHMFPTKAFDSESHRLEHAKRHANVVESLFQHADIAGGFGWCMFDYNTHKDFGSGDRICYHGVMNMFRIPKLAASVYASQSEMNDVLEISSSMDIGEHPGGNIEEVYAFTNADYVNLYKNDTFVKSFYPNKEKYGHMPHPPILVDDFIGELLEKNEKYSHANAETIKEVLRALVKYGQYSLPLIYKLKMAKVMLLEKLTMAEGMRLYYQYVGNWGGEATTYRFEAIKNNEIVNVIEKSATKKVYLRVTTDTTELREDHTYDVASVRVEVVNEKGEILPYYQGVITFETEGNIEIIGP